MPPEILVMIGSSAGGPRILKEIFHDLPRLNAAVILIQHMPRFINESVREILDELTGMDVRIAEDGDELRKGVVHIAPSEKHLRLIDNRRIVLFDGEKVNFVSPSVDIAMKSVQTKQGQNIVGVILTGMGRDGADGIQHIKKIGGVTIAQNEETSVIFGMPKEAIATGSVDWVLGPGEIRNKLIALSGIQH